MSKSWRSMVFFIIGPCALTVACNRASNVAVIEQGEWYLWEPGRGPKLEGWRLTVTDSKITLELVEWHLCENRLFGWGALPGDASHIKDEDWRIEFENMNTMLLHSSSNGLDSLYVVTEGNAVYPFRFERNLPSLAVARSYWEEKRRDALVDVCPGDSL